MSNDSKYTLKELENIFSKDFSTPLFFDLAERYFQNNDFIRAIKVLKIGIKTSSDSLDARYLLAKIYLLNNNIKKAEKTLSDDFKNKFYSRKILKLLIEIRDAQKRSQHETKRIVDILLDLYSDDAFGNRWIHNYTSNQKKGVKKIPKQDLTFKINDNIASLTLYNVLKNQKYYNQAIKVLDILENSNQINARLYKKEHAILNKLIS